MRVCFWRVPAALCFLCVALPVCADEPVTVVSLLRDMADYESVARFPDPEFRLKQESSHNRASIRPEDAKGWFTNKDYNSRPSDHNFVRVEEDNGQKEWVLMDHEGAGAIVRTWMPFLSPNQPDTDTLIRVYLDGSITPVLEGNMLGLLDGTGLIPYPLAHQSLRSAVSFFPIPYARSCKVTTTDQPFFYQLTYREYPAGTPVKTFAMDDFRTAKTLTQTVGEALLNPQPHGGEAPVAFQKTLGPNQEQSSSLPPGPAAVRELMVRLGSYEDPNVTRSVVLKMELDGKETVWCPVGDFFGTGIGLHPFQGWYRTVAEEGTMTCRWTMPYQRSGKVSVVNLGDRPVDVELAARTGAWEWDDRSMYFHAAWRGQYPVPTRPYSDWNYGTFTGRGVYVGDTLTIMNPVQKWWGEGDEKIWVDGEAFPSIFGTGTEDYYGYSWGGISTDFYEHPFHAQPRCHAYDKLHRKTNGPEKNTQGYSTETRTRSLDTMPFGSSLKLDMEVWSGSDCDMGYAVGMYWYGDDATTSNRKPDPQGALAVPPSPNMNAGPQPYRDKDDAETNMKRYDGSWEALQEMPVPAWFDDGKIGIFIHWGPYSVIGYRKEGRGYAEHVPKLLYDESDHYFPYMKKRWGACPPEFGYKDLIPEFTAANWDPDAWAALFKEVGATYVVFTAEHHDGYANWDSDLTPWNAVDTGPHRDLVGELGSAVRKQGLKYAPSYHRERHTGFFALGKYVVHSEPHPVIAEEIRRMPEAESLYGPFTFSKAFVDDYVARWKEIQEKYHPDMLWIDDVPIFTRDGNSTKTTPPVFKPEIQYFYDQYRALITDFMNEGAQRGQAVYVNNKGGNRNWPAGVGCLEKDNLKLKVVGPKWQSCTTFGSSYGYLESEERADSYKKTPENVVKEMIEVVSRNGNFLINIGPMFDGTIPPGQVKRLRAMGEWLKINGDAIYGTRYWKVHHQKSDNLAFTTRGKTLYAIALEKPVAPFVIEASGGWENGAVESVRLLGSKAEAKWELTPDGLKMTPPADLGESMYAWVFEIVTNEEQHRPMGRASISR